MLNRLFRIAGDVVSPVGDRGKATILMYHRTPADPDPLLYEVLDAAGFERQMTLMAQNFNVLPLAEACDRMAAGTLPSRAACITFDDGYANNVEVALPILRRLGLPATFFVATGYLDGGLMFNDVVIEAVRRARSGAHDLSELGLGCHDFADTASRRATIDALLAMLKYRPGDERRSAAGRLAALMDVALPRDLMMTSGQVRALHEAGMEIGGHTVTHPILALLDHAQARTEIGEGKRALEAITRSPVRVFAYPNGAPGTDYTPRDVELVSDAGFSAAVSTMPGVATCASDRYQLPRFGPWHKDGARLGMRLLLNCVKRRVPCASDSRK